MGLEAVPQRQCQCQDQGHDQEDARLHHPRQAQDSGDLDAAAQEAEERGRPSLASACEPGFRQYRRVPLGASGVRRIAGSAATTPGGRRANPDPR